MEQTYIMIKPDAYEKKIMGKIITRIEEEDFKILNIKMMKLNKQIINQHYSHLTHLDFYPYLLDFMMSGPVVGMIVEGKNAVSRMRDIIGPTKFDSQKSLGTIRGDFADSTTKNAIHGSDSIESAQVEIQRFFGNDTLI